MLKRENSNSIAPIANEPTVNTIKVTEYHESPRPIFKATSSDSFSSPDELSTANECSSDPSPLTKRLHRQCCCPTIMICDDDAFQHVFYVHFFSNMLDTKKIHKSKRDFKLSLHLSGEDLLTKYQELKACKCSNPVLVISDYSMGSKHMNGVSTAAKLRKAGYQGPLLLRSSETKENLTKEHSDFDKLLKEGILDNFLDKSDFAGLKEFVQESLLA